MKIKKKMRDFELIKFVMDKEASEGVLGICKGGWSDPDGPAGATCLTHPGYGDNCWYRHPS